ncbi:hypothetical protein [Fictibacillus macauensis]|nr:hypothetical protein [Fictibacillus macauensis]
MTLHLVFMNVTISVKRNKQNEVENERVKKLFEGSYEKAMHYTH